MELREKPSGSLSRGPWAQRPGEPQPREPRNGSGDQGWHRGIPRPAEGFRSSAQHHVLGGTPDIGEVSGNDLVDGSRESCPHWPQQPQRSTGSARRSGGEGGTEGSRMDGAKSPVRSPRAPAPISWDAKAHRPVTTHAVRLPSQGLGGRARCSQPRGQAPRPRCHGPSSAGARGCRWVSLQPGLAWRGQVERRPGPFSRAQSRCRSTLQPQPLQRPQAAHHHVGAGPKVWRLGTQTWRPGSLDLLQLKGGL